MVKFPVIKGLVSLVFLVMLPFTIFPQGLPPGWEFVPTPATHIISIKLAANPNINGFPINPGDYIGGFYFDNNSVYKCGGAVEWLGNQNTGIILFGDDSFTPEKDGFSSGEFIHWKVFSWSVEKEYDALVICDPGLPSSCTNFTSQGLAGLSAFNAFGFYLITSVQPENICQGGTVQLTAVPSGGSGNYSYLWSSIPTGFSSSIPNPQANPQINTQYFVQVSDGNESITLNVSVSVTPPPFVSCGFDQTICENQVVLLTGIMTNGNSAFWTTSGDGLFSDPSSLTTQYSPGLDDLLNGNVMLSLTAQPIAPCEIPFTDQLIVSFQYLPDVEAGVDQSICENESVMLIPEISNYSSVLWETNGDGVFDNPSIPETIYTPGPTDISNGNVSLSISVLPLTPCFNQANDFITVNFELLPSVNAGTDLAICQDGYASLVANATNYSALQWNTSGDGSFDNNTSLITNYFPGSNDVISGTVTLTLDAFSVLPCQLVVNDFVSLSIVKLPTVNAGPDATICIGMIHQLTASASNYDELLWTTSGDGTFDDQNALIAFYYPGNQDILNGNVVLTIEAFPQFPCNLVNQDELELFFQPIPTTNAGEDATITSIETYQCSGMANDFDSILWETSGDGLFSDPLILDPVYTPGNGDIFEGSVLLTLSAQPVFPCTTSIYDDLILTIDSITSINNSFRIAKMNIYPNPANSVLFFTFTPSSDVELTTRIVDIKGNSVREVFWKGDLFDYQNRFSLNVENIPPGLYLFEIICGNSRLSQKITIKH